MPIDKEKTQSNPFSTGGGGVNFETRVQAVFVVLLLTGQIAPCIPSWPITMIKLQGRYEGFNTDDFVLYAKDENTESEAKLLAQIKHSIAITEGNETLGEVMQAAWNDFNNDSLFDISKDSIALITGPLSASDIENVRTIMEWARYSLDEVEFINKINTSRFSSETKKNKLKVFRSHLNKANKGVEISDEQLWKFMRKFYILSYDLDVESGVTFSLLNSLIAQNTNENNLFVWSKIIDVVQYANQNSGTINIVNIPDEVSRLFNKTYNSRCITDIKKLKEHGEYILNGIQSKIAGIHIRRTEYLGQLIEYIESSRLVVVTGERGCGKSSIVKEFVEYIDGKLPIFYLRTEEIDKPHLHDIFSSIGIFSRIEEIEAYFAMIPKKYFLIESFEKLLELENTTAFLDLFRFLNKQQGWTIIASTRDYAYQQISFNYLQTLGIKYSVLRLEVFNEKELNEISYGIDYLKPLLENPHLKHILRNPFYLNLAHRVICSGGHILSTDGEKEFQAAVWTNVIQKSHEMAGGRPIKRKQIFIDLAVERAKHMVYGISGARFDPEILLILEKDALIRRNETTGLICPSHDIFEDWAIEQYIEDLYLSSYGDLERFLNNIGHEPAMNRAFRLWLHKKIRYNSSVNQLVISILKDKKINKTWQDEAIAAVLLGDNATQFLECLRDYFFENDCELLKRFCFTLRIVCKTPDINFIKQLGEGWEWNLLLPLIPEGNSWSEIIQFLFDYKDRMPQSLVTHIVALLNDWSSIIKIYDELPICARHAGLLALSLLEGKKDSYGDDRDRNSLIKIIMKVYPSISEEFNEMLNSDVFSVLEEGRRLLYVDDFCKILLTGIDTIFLCKSAPDLIIRLALNEWFIGKMEMDGFYYTAYRKEVDECFGMHRYKSSTEFFPPSGVRGPFAYLFRYHHRKALDFLLNLFNIAAEKYYQSDLDKEETSLPLLFDTLISKPKKIQIQLNDGTTVYQYCSLRLWNAYRGLSVLPYLLQSALMALENWLIYCAEKINEDSFLEWCFDYILRNSNSVMPTAVLTSIAIGFHEKVGKNALPILRVPEFYDFEMKRVNREGDINKINSFGTVLQKDPLSGVYSDERQEAALRKWRRKDLESLIVSYQFSSLRNETLKIIDELRLSHSQDEKWRFRLHRIDSREFKPEKDKENNRIIFTNEHIENDLLVIQEKTQKQHELYNRFSKLFMWSDKLVKNESLEVEYYSNWEAALVETKELLEVIKNNYESDFIKMQIGSIVKSAVIFVRDYSEHMKEGDLSWCFSLIIESVLAGTDQEQVNFDCDKSDLDGKISAASVLPILFDFDESEEDRLYVKKIIATALTHPNFAIRMKTAEGIKAHLWKRDHSFAHQCILGSIYYSCLEPEFMHKYHSAFRIDNEEGQEDERKPESYKNWISGVREQLCQDTISVDIGEITFDSYNAEQLFVTFLMMPYGSEDDLHISFIKKMITLLFEVEKRKDDYSNRSKKKEISYEVPFDFAKELASFFQEFSNEKLQTYSDLLCIGCEDAPDFIKTFLIHLDYYTELQNNKGVFWSVWEVLAKKVQNIAIGIEKSYSERSKYDKRTNLIRRMLYADTSWQKNDYKKQDIKYGVSSIIKFVENTGKNPDVFEAMSSLMYHFSKLFFDKGLLILSSFQSEEIEKNLLYRPNSIFYLEKSIHRYLMIDSTSLLQRNVHQACLKLLNQLVERASSEAYYLREHLIRSRRIAY